ncbi:MAG: hypothetical protein L6Q49_05160 [Anaerolineales bacterium]|nr:hypothetical protein [Anaerolineales bacterium]
MKKFTRMFHLFIICALFLGACNLPADEPEGAEASSTFAAQTVEALLKITPTVTFTSVVPPTNSPVPTNTNTPVPTATPVCPQGQFVTDVTIPDGTIMNPGQTFTKKWRIRNTGTCAWSGYSMVFDSGDSMSGAASQPIGVVNPGQEIDLEVNLTAPSTAGNYRGYWRIVTNNNVLVPMLNGYQGRSFYVDIKVQAPPTATATNTSVPFTVTNVTVTTSGACGGFTATANITTNGPGTVTYTWKFSDGATVPNETLNFAAAGTQSRSYTWSVGAAGTHWIDIQILSPINQQFGRAQITCP